ncbi:MAG: hypothetical protein WC277_07115 [Bacilli bacterium]|jgi:hypothetical protein
MTDIEYFANTSDETLRRMAQQDHDEAEYMRLNRLLPIPQTMSAEDHDRRARWYEAELARREALRQLERRAGARRLAEESAIRYAKLREFAETHIDVLASTNLEASDE